MSAACCCPFSLSTSFTLGAFGAAAGRNVGRCGTNSGFVFARGGYGGDVETTPLRRRIGLCCGMVHGKVEMVREMRSVDDESMLVLLLFEAAATTGSKFEACMVCMMMLSARCCVAIFDFVSCLVSLNVPSTTSSYISSLRLRRQCRLFTLHRYSRSRSPPSTDALRSAQLGC
jgi:hypothetical protein